MANTLHHSPAGPSLMGILWPKIPCKRPPTPSTKSVRCTNRAVSPALKWKASAMAIGAAIDPAIINAIHCSDEINVFIGTPFFPFKKWKIPVNIIIAKQILHFKHKPFRERGRESGHGGRRHKQGLQTGRARVSHVLARKKITKCASVHLPLKEVCAAFT